MSRLKIKYHIDFKEYLDFETAWKNTSPAELVGWEKLAENNRVSTYALLWSLYKVWVTQINNPTITNFLYIEWLFRDLHLLWPLGTVGIPIATLGLAKCGWSILKLTEKNATE